MEPKPVTVKLRKETHKLAKIAAAKAGIPLAELVEAILRAELKKGGK